VNPGARGIERARASRAIERPHAVRQHAASTMGRMDHIDDFEDALAEILELATEARVDRSRWSDYVARAGAVARRIGCAEAGIEDLPLMAASRAELALRTSFVRDVAARRSARVLAVAERGEF
jgi:hypothetical protein